ncbi:hypothetical protein [Robertkochia aurantiaca]|uniref:hypothetical protein n=1 Tax=Robertkochia aurantiaca TaxID=2873700 RepID=UPI001CCA1214|nr:hypothetical protein [Robertkochia sp. 3YJGBD-33]
MQIRILLFLSLLCFVACDNSDIERNPFLIERSFSYDINLNLPQFGSLSTPGNAIYIGSEGVGIRGVIVFNSGFGNYLAWEASCPNHQPNSCSTMTITDGVFSVCSCDDYRYSLANGALVSELEEEKRVYPLLNYRVTANANILRVFN